MSSSTDSPIAGCGGDIRLIAFITEPGPIRKILTHLGEPLEPPPVSPARGPPTESGEIVQIHDDRDVFQTSPDELPAIDAYQPEDRYRSAIDRAILRDLTREDVDEFTSTIDQMGLSGEALGSW